MNYVIAILFGLSLTQIGSNAEYKDIFIIICLVLAYLRAMI